MNCEKCNQPATSSTRVYYAAIQNVHFDRSNTLTTSKTTTTTTYGNVFNKDIYLCDNCKIKQNRKDLLLMPLYILILLSPIIVIFQNSKIVGGIVGAIFLIVVVFVVIDLIKKNYTDISKFNSYQMARKLLKKQLKSQGRKVKYEFWQEYPSHLKVHIN